MLRTINILNDFFVDLKVNFFLHEICGEFFYNLWKMCRNRQYKNDFKSTPD